MRCVATHKDDRHRDTHQREGEEIKVEALVDEPVQHSGAAGNGAAHRLQKPAQPANVDTKGRGELLVHEYRRGGPAQPLLMVADGHRECFVAFRKL